MVNTASVRRPVYRPLLFRALSEMVQTRILLISHPFRRKTRNGWGTEVYSKKLKCSITCALFFTLHLRQILRCGKWRFGADALSRIDLSESKPVLPEACSQFFRHRGHDSWKAIREKTRAKSQLPAE